MSQSKIPKLSLNEKRLTRRYLIWCYKTTKEQLDRIDRYFTQLEVDQFVLNELIRFNALEMSQGNTKYKSHIDEFRKYIATKRENVIKQKYVDARQLACQPHYLYLQQRFKALEKAISRILGRKELKKIAELYEHEMTKRILEAKDH